MLPKLNDIQHLTGGYKMNTVLSLVITLVMQIVTLCHNIRNTDNKYQVTFQG